MPGRVKVVSLYTQELLRDHPDWMFLFGDNMQRRGRGGQAKVCRDRPNAVGVPTKWTPGTRGRDYMRDTDLDLVRFRIDEAFRRASEHLRAGGVVVLPRDGLGTGRAELPRRAPVVMAYIEDHVRRLKRMADEE